MSIRSDKVIFIPFCTLCQSAKASGLVKHYPTVVEPLVKLLNELKINIVQMPCPEMLGEGLVREPHDISYYERPDFIKLCKQLALAQTDIIEKFITDGFDIVGIMGIERSPSCSLGYVRRNGKIVEGSGVFMREIVAILDKSNRDIFHISLDLNEMDPTLRVIESRILNVNER